VRNKVITGELSEGHARALLGAKDASKIEELAERVMRGRLNVRATEQLVKGVGSAKGAAVAKEKSAAVRDLETRLTRALGTKVEVRDEGNKGEVVIPYANLDQLDRVLAKLLK
jgi:ParB family chromosome partitioning protein